ncbi:hypothetical protein KIM372_16360 [Bombiscardovia nodaiensis]|uniref:Uncharacterized protein n=1 Tax=Bombiscardovia nodaiensis TaxID=2932181 RepID=A0ABM8BA02_9BIFI|nr:hypothetical protein KIM372_16360 [Bombiscardovia nodaiensis]
MKLSSISLKRTAAGIATAALLATGVGVAVNASHPAFASGCNVGSDSISACFPDVGMATAVADHFGVPMNTTFDSSMQDGSHTLGNVNETPFSIDFSTQTISNFSGLENLYDSGSQNGISMVKLNKSQVATAKNEINSATNIKVLDLTGSPTSKISDADLTSMAADINSMSNIVSLTLNDNEISTVAPLAPLASSGVLKVLSLGQNKFTSASSLSAFTSLQSLDLPENQIEDVSPLAGLSDLESLDLTGNKIADISPLNALVSGSTMNTFSASTDISRTPSIDGQNIVVDSIKGFNGSYLAPTPVAGTPQFDHFDQATGKISWSSSALTPGTHYALQFRDDSLGTGKVFEGTVTFDGINIANANTVTFKDAKTGLNKEVKVAGNTAINTVDIPVLPELTGFAFDDWYPEDPANPGQPDVNAGAVNFSTPITADETVVANWVARDLPHIVLQDNSDSNNVRNLGTFETVLTPDYKIALKSNATLPKPVREGYDLAGWVYADGAHAGEAVDFQDIKAELNTVSRSVAGYKNVSVAASWTEKVPEAEKPAETVPETEKPAVTTPEAEKPAEKAPEAEKPADAKAPEAGKPAAQDPAKGAAGVSSATGDPKKKVKSEDPLAASGSDVLPFAVSAVVLLALAGAGLTVSRRMSNK